MTPFFFKKNLDNTDGQVLNRVTKKTAQLRKLRFRTWTQHLHYQARIFTNSSLSVLFFAQLKMGLLCAESSYFQSYLNK